MKKADYSYWYEWAKKNMDVNIIIEHYLGSHEVVKDYLNYIHNMENTKNCLIHQLLDAELDDTDIEDVMFRYGIIIQDIYLELGLKIGARLGAEHLVIEKKCKV